MIRSSLAQSALSGSDHVLSAPTIASPLVPPLSFSKMKLVRHASSPESRTAKKEVGVPHSIDTKAEEEEVEEQEGQEEQAEDEGDNMQRPWNLRTRKLISTRGFMSEKERTYNGNGNCRDFWAQANRLPKSMRLRGMVASTMATAVSEFFRRGNGGGKRKFWITLSKDEIKEDVFVMTGNKLSR